MQIETVKIESVKPYRLNAKKHPQSQIEGLAESIRRFGFNQPIVLDKDNVLIIGHGRVEAAKLCGLSELPAIRKSDLTEKEVRAYRLLDNRLAETSWDWELLTMDLEDLPFDFSTFNVDFALPDDFTPPEFKEYDESVKDEVETIKCPHCGESFAK